MELDSKGYTMKKVCKRCRKEKEISEFWKDKRLKDGLNIYCKECMKKFSEEYYHTEKGLISYMYKHIKQNSKKRKHKLPNFSKKELIKWLYKNKFKKLFNQWKKSGFNKWLVPSIDRLDDSKPYTFDNIRLVTWAENYKKSRKDISIGKLKHNNPPKPVLMLDKNFNILKEYISASEAARFDGFIQSSICEVCNNKRKTHKGYIWIYKENYKRIKND